MSLNKEFLKACQTNDIETVRRLIEHVDIDTQNDNSETGLIISIEENNIEILSFLLNNGANINHQDIGGYTTLIHAIDLENINTVALLIRNGADINLQDNNGWTALMWAAQIGLDDVVDLLIKSGAIVDVKDNNGKSALTISVNYRNYSIVEYLVKIDSATDIAMSAAIDDDDFISMYILDNNLLNAQDENGDTLIIKACRSKYYDQVLYLYERGADFFIENNQCQSAYIVLEQDLPPKIQALKEMLILQRSVDYYDEPGHAL